MMGVFLGLLALTWMPIWTRGWQAEGAVCTGELMGLMEPYADIGAALLAAACVVVGFMAITIIMALKRGMGEDLASASSEFYYFLVIGLPWVSAPLRSRNTADRICRSLSYPVTSPLLLGTTSPPSPSSRW